MFNLFSKKRPFNKLILEIHFTDGSKEMTDPITYKKFKELTDARIMGEEIRKATEKDYKEALEDFLEYCQNPYLSDYFSVSIRGKTIELPSTNILKIIQHKK